MQLNYEIESESVSKAALTVLVFFYVKKLGEIGLIFDISKIGNMINYVDRKY